MEQLIAQIDELIEKIKNIRLNSLEDVEDLRIKFLGNKGIVKGFYEHLKEANGDFKKVLGLKINELRQIVEQRVDEGKKDFGKKMKGNVYKEQDISLPSYPSNVGTGHPIAETMNEILSVFEKIGFNVVEGPEIEDDWHNFTALNIPETHPARDMQDTFYISQDPKVLLRTHTSNVQIRELKKKILPLRIVCPGRVFRNETISARSHCFFHQIEGLFVDEGVSFADLKQTLYYFVKTFFGPDVEVRFRPSYFPFTEPSAEMDISCLICKGKGCGVCKHSGWVEILGSGMVHPKVLENCGIDYKRYNGYAWGMGVERITMLKYQIKDLRLFSENDVRFLRQFKRF